MCGSPRICGWLLVGMAKLSHSWTNNTHKKQISKNQQTKNPKKTTDPQKIEKKSLSQKIKPKKPLKKQA